MRKRTLWTILAAIFAMSAIYAPFSHQKTVGDTITAIIGCLLFAALFWWLRITARDIAGKPNTARALAAFSAFVGDDILLGHNIRRFDMPMIQAELRRARMRELQNPIIDTLPIAQAMFPGECNRVVDLIRRLGIARGKPPSRRRRHANRANLRKTQNTLNNEKRQELVTPPAAYSYPQARRRI